MNSRSIRTDIILKVTSAAFLVILLFTSVIVYFSYRFVIEKEYENAQILSRKYANEFNAEMLAYLSKAQTFATTFEQITPISREQVNNILQHFLEEHRKVLGVFANYEPNQFDGADNKYKNKQGSDSTGRFLPYWNKLRESGIPKLEVGVNMDISDWYLEPKRTGTYKISDPYIYEKLLLVSFICPIMKDGKFIGITGVDSTPENFHNIIKKIKVYESGYALLVSNSGTFVSFKDSSQIGKLTINEWATKSKNKELMAIASEIEEGMEGFYETVDPNTGKESLMFYTPVETGNWSFIVVVPKSEIYASIYKIIAIQVLFGLFFIIAINLILYKTIDKWIEPILALADYARITSGKFESLTRRKIEKELAKEKNEIVTLKNSFDYFVTNLMTSYNELDSFINNTSDAIVIINRKFEIIRVNKGFVNLFGWTETEVMGETIKNLPKGLKEKLENVFAGYKDKIIPFGREEKTKEGKALSISVTATPIKDYEGNVIAIATISRDVSDLVLAEQKMKEAKEKAEKADKMKSEFLAQMSHEIRTPINTILSFTSLLQEELSRNIDSELEDVFKIIGNAGKRIIRTIDLLLNMSELQTGSYHHYPQDILLGEEVLEPLFFEFKPLAEKKNLELNYHFSGDFKIHIDEYTVSQIFNNLIDNAIKYTEEGNIAIKLYTKEDKTAVEISDTGIGIKEEYLPDLFLPFSQEEQGYTRRFEGNGLGLALVKKYCELNNAEIYVNSKKQTGTKFTVIFN